MIKNALAEKSSFLYHKYFPIFTKGGSFFVYLQKSPVAKKSVL